MDFPAPVSPVIAVKPPENSSSSASTMAKFRISRELNIDSNLKSQTQASTPGGIGQRGLPGLQRSDLASVNRPWPAYCLSFAGLYSILEGNQPAIPQDQAKCRLEICLNHEAGTPYLGVMILLLPEAERIRLR
jgi:hypothetical protein